MAAARTFKTRMDLPPERRKKLIALLNQHLADTFDLFGQCKQAHWNVKGLQFHQLHELFDDLAEQVKGYVDLIAERATTLGGTALGTVRMAAGASRLAEYPLDPGGSMQHVEALAVRFAALAATTRAAIDARGRLGRRGQRGPLDRSVARARQGPMVPRRTPAGLMEAPIGMLCTHVELRNRDDHAR